MLVRQVYLEAYTSVLGVDVDALERLYGKSVTTCDRRWPRGADTVLTQATTTDVAFCVVGDAPAATTHSISVTRGGAGSRCDRCITRAS